MMERNKEDSDLMFSLNKYRYFWAIASISAGVEDNETAKRIAYKYH